jgi:hypothetical protein
MRAKRYTIHTGTITATEKAISVVDFLQLFNTALASSSVSVDQRFIIIDSVPKSIRDNKTALQTNIIENNGTYINHLLEIFDGGCYAYALTNKSILNEGLSRLFGIKSEELSHNWKLHRPGNMDYFSLSLNRKELITNIYENFRYADLPESFIDAISNPKQIGGKLRYKFEKAVDYYDFQLRLFTCTGKFSDYNEVSLTVNCTQEEAEQCFKTYGLMPPTKLKASTAKLVAGENIEHAIRN